MAYDFIKREEVYTGVIIDVVQDTITLPDGKQAVREVVQRVGAAAIVPVDRDGNIVFVRQYRHPAGGEILEIPAGTFDSPDEDPLGCATRELAEETGFRAEKFTLLTKAYSAVGFCTEVIHIYLAEGLTVGEQHLDPDEFVFIETYPLEQAIRMIFNGEIQDSKTMIGLLAYQEMLNGTVRKSGGAAGFPEGKTSEQ